eukprot:TRINITY_DN5662_c0_g1_i2.p1 TRINITY_DN5662_c0_g1~~TRINITY_DN5662_c0_g1_i2.p1  ORF type:complete len:713 (-),score=80.89 TRINITY_DN5662_c0_g1_i2:151-2289(-)
MWSTCGCVDPMTDNRKNRWHRIQSILEDKLGDMADIESLAEALGSSMCSVECARSLLDHYVRARTAQVSVSDFIQWVLEPHPDEHMSGWSDDAEKLLEEMVRLEEKRLVEQSDLVGKLKGQLQLEKTRRASCTVPHPPSGSPPEPNDANATANGTSLSALVADWNAPVVMVSCPEFGHGGNPVMQILEQLPKHLKTTDSSVVDKPDGGTQVQTIKPSFTLAVDFKDSSSSLYCNSRVRWLDLAGKPLLGENDFTRKYTLDDLTREMYRSAELEWREPDNQADSDSLNQSIANSFWSVFWRGQVGGALTGAFAAAPDVAVSYAECKERAKNTEHTVVLNEIQGETARVVVAVSIEGGPVTRFERTQIPDVCRAVISNLRRRGYSWGASVALLWCHFDTVEDFLRSASGVPNLVRNTNSADLFMLDYWQRSMSFIGNGTTSSTHRLARNLLSSSVEEILEDGKQKRFDAACLTLAAKDGDLDALKFLMRRGVDVNVKAGIEKKSALHWATEFGHLETSLALLEARADIEQLVGGEDAVANYDMRPLHLAARCGHAAVVSALCEKRACFEARMAHDQTALMMAAACNRESPVNGPDVPGVTATVTALLDARADVAVCDDSGITALHFAAMMGHHGALRVLLSRNADVDSAAQAAFSWGRTQVVAGTTPLHLAAMYGYANIVRYLLDARASLDAKDSLGRNAESLATGAAAAALKR